MMYETTHKSAWKETHCMQFHAAAVDNTKRVCSVAICCNSIHFICISIDICILIQQTEIHFCKTSKIYSSSMFMVILNLLCDLFGQRHATLQFIWFCAVCVVCVARV